MFITEVVNTYENEKSDSKKRMDEVVVEKETMIHKLKREIK